MSTISASQIKSLQCPRKWEFSYHEKLESIKVSEALLFGSAFHEGMAYMLGKSVKQEVLIAPLHAEASWAARQYLKSNDPHDEFISINDIQARLDAMFEYYIPLIGLGTKYRVATTLDLFHNKDLIVEPMIEYKLEVPINDDYTFIGYVDAILVDLKTNELVVVDWKTVATPRDDTTAMLDGQLQLYAAALGQLGADVNRVCMWQMRKDVPKPAKMLKSGQPSTAVQATTFNVWKSTNPAWQSINAPLGESPHKPSWNEFVRTEGEHEFVTHNKKVKTQAPPKGYTTWEAWAAEKLKPESYFNAPVETFMTAQSKAIAWQNLEATVWMVNGFRERLVRTPLSLPALQNGGFAGTCMMCQFRELCVTLQAGDDPTAIIVEKYKVK